MRKFSFILVLFLFLSGKELYSSGLLWLDIELWCELEPMVNPEGSDFPVPRAEAMKRLLDEARILFSYMIYGGQFDYTPPDTARRVAEVFVMEPFFEILWGDENLEVRESRVKNGRLYAIFRYRLAEFQEIRIRGWQSNVYPSVTGRGTGNLFKGYTEKFKALENSIKEGIRHYLRQQIYNKPRLISGEFLIQAVPVTIIQEGEYVTTSRMKLNVKHISAYDVF